MDRNDIVNLLLDAARSVVENRFGTLAPSLWSGLEPNLRAVATNLVEQAVRNAATPPPAQSDERERLREARIERPAADRVDGKLRISPGRLQERGSEQLAKAKLYARQRDPSSLNDAVLVAGFHAKKLGKTMWVYEGNSFMHMVYRVTMKESDAFDAINNTGDKVVSVTPDLQVFMHEVRRQAVRNAATPPPAQSDERERS